MINADEILTAIRRKYQNSDWHDDEWASWAIPKIVAARLLNEFRQEQDSSSYWGA